MKDNFCTILKLHFHKMQIFLSKHNQEIVEDPHEADIIIIGVCAAFDADESRSLELLDNVQGIESQIYIFGCLTQVNPQLTKKRGKNFATWEENELVKDILKEKMEIDYNDIELPSEFRTKTDYRVYNPKKHFVGISKGCSFKCSYCPHKIGVGKIKSNPPEKVLTQISRLIGNGAEEILLTGTDVACYGKDINYSFPKLLKNILNLPNKTTKFHIAQYNPEGLYFDIETMIKCCQNNLITDFQLPIQTADENLLKLMKRDYNIEVIINFIKKVKNKNKHCFFRTDIMVGFPNETMESLNKTIDFVSKYYDEIAVYAFEKKKCTPIFNESLNFLEPDEIQRRVDYTIKKLKSNKKLVHSGGQVLSSLIIADNFKEKKIKKSGKNEK